jgi:hypothetical protein
VHGLCDLGVRVRVRVSTVHGLCDIRHDVIFCPRILLGTKKWKEEQKAKE